MLYYLDTPSQRKASLPNLDTPHFLHYTAYMDEQIPAYYMICLNNACPHAESCLRQLHDREKLLVSP